MNCSECEQLFDAYLDGQLAGSLRLEFDAHRLRCRRCQQALAMLEAVGHVIAADTDAPELSEDFTARVMQELAPPAAQPRRIEVPWTRVAVVTAALAQAAAILLVVVLWNTPAPVSEAPTDMEMAGTVTMPENDPAYQALHNEITARIEDRIWGMHHAGAKLTADVANLARYLDIMVPEDVARESSKMAQSNPWEYFWGSVQPPAEDAPEADASADDLHSI